MVRLVVFAENGSVAVECPLGRQPLYVGRNPANSVVLSQPSVSGRHAIFWVDETGAWVEDLSSRNGTFRTNGTRLKGPCQLKPGEAIRLGHDAWVTVRGDPTSDPWPMVLLDDGAAAVPFRGDTFRIGPESDAHVHGISGLTLTRTERGLHLCTDDGTADHALAYGTSFELDGRTYRVEVAEGEIAATFDAGDAGYPYEVTVAPPGPQAARARFDDPRAERIHVLGSENRATLIYLLATALGDDRQQGSAPDVAGWRPDTDIAAGLWGRAGEGRNLNVLVTRVRAELRGASFNPWCIEKRSGQTRLLVDTVRVADGEHW